MADKNPIGVHKLTPKFTSYSLDTQDSTTDWPFVHSYRKLQHDVSPRKRFDESAETTMHVKTVPARVHPNDISLSHRLDKLKEQELALLTQHHAIVLEQIHTVEQQLRATTDRMDKFSLRAQQMKLRYNLVTIETQTTDLRKSLGKLGRDMQITHPGSANIGSPVSGGASEGSDFEDFDISAKKHSFDPPEAMTFLRNMPSGSLSDDTSTVAKTILSKKMPHAASTPDLLHKPTVYRIHDGDQEVAKDISTGSTLSNIEEIISRFFSELETETNAQANLEIQPQNLDCDSKPDTVSSYAVEPKEGSSTSKEEAQMSTTQEQNLLQEQNFPIELRTLPTESQKADCLPKADDVSSSAVEPAESSATSQEEAQMSKTQEQNLPQEQKFPAELRAILPEIPENAPLEGVLWSELRKIRALERHDGKLELSGKMRELGEYARRIWDEKNVEEYPYALLILSYLRHFCDDYDGLANEIYDVLQDPNGPKLEPVHAKNVEYAIQSYEWQLHRPKYAEVTAEDWQDLYKDLSNRLKTVQYKMQNGVEEEEITDVPIKDLMDIHLDQIFTRNSLNQLNQSIEVSKRLYATFDVGSDIYFFNGKRLFLLMSDSCDQLEMWFSKAEHFINEFNEEARFVGNIEEYFEELHI